MKISKERLEELRKIFKEDFNTDLTDQELHEASFNLVGYFDTLMQCAEEDIRKGNDDKLKPANPDCEKS